MCAHQSIGIFRKSYDIIITMKTNQNSEKVIVVQQREGCFLQTLNVGCALIFAIIGLLVLGSCWGIYKITEDSPKQTRQIESEREEVKPTKQAPTISHKRVEPTTRATHVEKTTEHIHAQSPSPTISQEKPVEKPICSRCNGTGTIESKTRCMKCGGAGRIYVNGAWKSCPKTISAGRKPCPDCNR